MTQEEERIKNAQRQKEWRRRNPDKVREIRRRWYERHRKSHRLKLEGTYYSRHREEILAKSKLRKKPIDPRLKVGFKIIEGDCWIWTGAPNKDGYGQRNNKLATHYLWKLTTGQAVPPGYDLHHLCSNKMCVNPDHLQLLTKIEHRRWHRRQLRQ